MALLVAPESLSTAWSVLIAAVVGQVVVGVLFLIGFVAIVRRFMDKEVPAQLAAVNGTVQLLHADLKGLATELREMRQQVTEHEVRINYVEKLNRPHDAS